MICAFHNEGLLRMRWFFLTALLSDEGRRAFVVEHDPSDLLGGDIKARLEAANEYPGPAYLSHHGGASSAPLRGR